MGWERQRDTEKVQFLFIFRLVVLLIHLVTIYFLCPKDISSCLYSTPHRSPSLLPLYIYLRLTGSWPLRRNETLDYLRGDNTHTHKKYSFSLSSTLINPGMN